MELQTALRLLDLENNPTRSETQAAYRRLIMKFHPDRNPRRTQWAHTMTTRIHEAYTLVVAQLESQGHETTVKVRPRRKTAAPTKPFHQVEQEVLAERRRREEELADIRAREALFLDALGFYYAHRLDRAQLRRDGSQHLRYRRALRQLHRAEATIQQAKHTVPDLQDRTENLRAFASKFTLCAERPAPPAPIAGGPQYSGYRHLGRGIEHLDATICTSLVPGLRNFGEPIEPRGRLTLSYHELMTVLTQFRDQPWLEEAVLRMDLVHAFSAYFEIRTATD